MNDQYVFHVVSGLETIAKQELVANGIVVNYIHKKIIIGEYKGDIRNFSKLLTIDDVGLILEITRDYNSNDLPSIISHTLELKLLDAIKSIKTLRTIDKKYCITVSKFKVDLENYTRDTMPILIDTINQITGYDYVEKDHTNLDIRMDIDKEKVISSVKVFTKSLYKRKYIQEDYLGSLKPTIASSLIKLALSKTKAIKPRNIVDTFCGSGTILCEGISQGYEVFGGDIKPLACKIAINRLKRISPDNPQIHEESASKTSWHNNQFDIAISNPPWNEKVKIENMKTVLSESIIEYARIIKKDGTLCILTKFPDIVVKKIKKSFKNHIIEKFQISFNGQQPTIVIAYKNYYDLHKPKR